MNMSVPDPDDLLAMRLRALGHPARLAIVRELARADRCHCGHIVRVLPLAQSTVSQHLKILKDAGLIAGTLEGPRSCYCLDRDVLTETAALLGSLLTQTVSSARADMREAMSEILASSDSDPICSVPPAASSPPAAFE